MLRMRMISETPKFCFKNFLKKKKRTAMAKDSLKHKRFSGSASNRNSWDSWFKYGVAAAAIGIGVCLSLVRQ